MRSIDEQHSLVKYLFDNYAIENHLERRLTKVSRPYFRIEMATGGVTRLSPIGYLDLRQWILWYHGLTENTTRNVGDEITVDLTTRQAIVGYLKDFPYTSPTLQAYNDALGTLSGTFDVQITGLIGADECNASPTKTIVVSSPNDAIRIQFPKLPFGKARFDSYNLYVKIGSAFALQKNVLHGSDSFTNVQTTLVSLGAGVVPPTSSELLYGRINIEQVDFDMIEDPEQDGTWDARIGLTTQSSGLVRADARMNRLHDDNSPDMQELLIQQIDFRDADLLPSVTVPVVLP